MALDVDVIRWGRQRARAGTWRGDRGVAYLNPLPDAPVPTTAFIRRCLDTLQARGFSRVVTGALAPPEQRAFLAAGFIEAERLHLLAHDLLRLPDVPTHGVTLRRAHRADRAEVLALDHRAFPAFWRLDDAGLTDAMNATPRARFMVATDADDRLLGYAVTGRAGRRGYLQRLAVDPDAQGRGLGAALTVDGLRWLRRWRGDVCVVNTQLDNVGALALYERMGFRRLPQGLAVLAAGLPTA